MAKILKFVELVQNNESLGKERSPEGCPYRLILVKENISVWISRQKKSFFLFGGASKANPRNTIHLGRDVDGRLTFKFAWGLLSVKNDIADSFFMP